MLAFPNKYQDTLGERVSVFTGEIIDKYPLYNAKYIINKSNKNKYDKLNRIRDNLPKINLQIRLRH